MRLTRGAVVIASVLTEAPLLRVTVEPSPQNGLGTTSQAMIDHIQSVRLQRIGEVVGQLADADLQAITRAMAIYLGLADPSPRAQRRAAERPA